MKLHARKSRRRFLARTVGAAGALALSGCDALSRTEWFPKVLGAGEKLSQAAHHLITPRNAMAQEFSEVDLSPTFRSNGTAMPNDARYRALATAGFADYRLEVGGLVEQPASLSLAELRALPSRTQITRHDCVEGWSAIGKWRGARLGALLETLRPTREARYVMFYCADPMEDDGTSPYYDVNADGIAGPGDALDVINHLNAFPSSGESPHMTGSMSSPGDSDVQPDDLLGLLAIDQATASKRRTN